MDLNHVFVSGRLTRDPELRYTPAGKAVCDLNVAVNRFYKDASGAQKEDTTFVSVVVWNKRAELCAEYLRKGSGVVVNGRLMQDHYEIEGRKVTKTRVVADDVQFMGRKKP
jgi:single-strand DNA-binding protein